MERQQLSRMVDHSRLTLGKVSTAAQQPLALRRDGRKMGTP